MKKLWTRKIPGSVHPEDEFLIFIETSSPLHPSIRWKKTEQTTTTFNKPRNEGALWPLKESNQQIPRREKRRNFTSPPYQTKPAMPEMPANSRLLRSNRWGNTRLTPTPTTSFSLFLSLEKSYYFSLSPHSQFQKHKARLVLNTLPLCLLGGLPYIYLYFII